MTAGVDIYRYQTVTDWSALKRAVGWSWVKLTDGNSPAVVRGDKQVNGCKSVGLPVGGYHYAQPGNPTDQARMFLNEVRRLGATDIAPALDLEAPFTPGASAVAYGKQFLAEVVRQGFRPAVYMSASWAGSMRPDSWGIPGLVIWVAAYGGNDGGGYSTKDPAKVRRYYSGHYDVHQHTSNARVPGISGVVDLNWALTGVPFNSKQEADDVALDQELFQFKTPDGRTMGVSALDMLGNLYAERFYGSATAPWAGPSGRAIDLGEAAEGPAELTDEQVDRIAEAVAERGAGASKEDVAAAVRAAFAKAGQA